MRCNAVLHVLYCTVLTVQRCGTLRQATVDELCLITQSRPTARRRLSCHGRVLDTEEIKMRTALREIAKIHEGDFRLTANQNLIIGGVAADAKATIDALLAEYGLDKNNLGSALRLNSMACVALPTCGLALAESERYLPDLVTELDGVIEIRRTNKQNHCKIFNILLFDSKETTFKFGHFRTISGHFFANYIIIFHKN